MCVGRIFVLPQTSPDYFFMIFFLCAFSVSTGTAREPGSKSKGSVSDDGDASICGPSHLADLSESQRLSFITAKVATLTQRPASFARDSQELFNDQLTWLRLACYKPGHQAPPSGQRWQPSMRPLSRNACLVYETSQDDRILRIAHLGGGEPIRPDASVAFLAGPPNDLGSPRHEAGPHSLAAGRNPPKIQNSRPGTQRPKLPKHCEAAPVAATSGKRTTLGKLDTFVGLTVTGNVPAGLPRGVWPCLCPSSPGWAAEKGAKRRYHLPALRLAPPAAAALLWRRG